MSRILRFWVAVECDEIKNHHPHRSRTEPIAQILCEFEDAGDAMRYLTVDGRVAWKATPRMLTRLADAKQEALDDLAEWL